MPKILFVFSFEFCNFLHRRLTIPVHIMLFAVETKAFRFGWCYSVNIVAASSEQSRFCMCQIQLTGIIQYGAHAGHKNVKSEISNEHEEERKKTKKKEKKKKENKQLNAIHVFACAFDRLRKFLKHWFAVFERIFTLLLRNKTEISIYGNALFFISKTGARGLWRRWNAIHSSMHRLSACTRRLASSAAAAVAAASTNCIRACLMLCKCDIANENGTTDGPVVQCSIESGAKHCQSCHRIHPIRPWCRLPQGENNSMCFVQRTFSLFVAVYSQFSRHNLSRKFI